MSFYSSVDETMNQQKRTIELRDNNESLVYIWSAAHFRDRLRAIKASFAHTSENGEKKKKRFPAFVTPKSFETHQH